MISLSLILVLALAGTTTRAEAPFRDGVEYIYDVDASMTTESMLSNEFASITFIRAQLTAVANSKESQPRALFKMKNIEAAVQHGNNIAPDESRFKDIKELSEHLSNPFYILFNDSKVAGISFGDKDEPVWSHNFKRSMAALFQINLASGAYHDEELSLHGTCGVHYYNHPATNDEFAVSKDYDFDSCTNRAGRNRTFVNMPGYFKDSPNTQRKMAGLTASIKYLVSPNRNHPELVRIESISTIWSDPFGVTASTMRSSSNMTVTLRKIRRSTGPPIDKLFSKQIPFETSLDFVFGHQYDGIDPSQIDLKAPQNLMLHPEAIILGQENLRRKTLIDLIAAVDHLQVSTSEERIDLNRIGLSAVSFQLGSLDYDNAMILFKELSISDNNEKLSSAKNMFLDLLLHSGSNVALILLRDLIHSDQLDELTAARLVGFAGVFVKQPTEKLLKEFQNVGDYKIDKEDWTVMHNAAVLSVAALVAKTCPHQSSCKDTQLSKWQKDYFNKFNDAISFADKGLYLHALHNLGYGAALEDVLDLLLLKIPNDDESGQDLKIYMINGLGSYSNQANVKNVLTNLLRDPSGNFRVKIAAVSAILYYPSVQGLDLIRYILGSETNAQVRQFLISTVKTLASAKNPNTQYLKEMAKQMLNMMKDEKITTGVRSAEYAFDVLEESVAFGSQLNIKTTAGEFDDIPSFVAGKVLYFIQGVTLEPFAFTVRSSGLRKYLSELFSSTLRDEDLNLSRLHATMEDFKFAERTEHPTSLDLSFTLHGTTIMFYHLDHTFLQGSIKSAKNLELLQDIKLNMQRYAATGAFLYTQPNGLGMPVSHFFSAPILISFKGAINKLRTAKGFGREIILNLAGEICGDHGILTHVSPFNMTQGVVRNRKAIFNVPLNLKVIFKDRQLDLTYINQLASNPLELASLARTVLIQRPCQGSEQLLNKVCPKCNPLVIIKRLPSAPLKTETITNLTSTYMGTEVHAQVFECDSGRSTGKQLALVLNALNPADMSFRSNIAGWAYLSFIRLQHYLFIQPDGRHCGYRGRVFRSAHLPVTEVFLRIKVKTTIGDDPEKTWQMGKFGMKIDSNWRGETAASDRKCEVDVSYEYQGAGSLNMFNIRVITDSSPLVNIKDNIICLRADSNFQAAPADIVDISVYDKPPSAKANVEFVMGNPSPSSRNQCPTGQFRFKTAVEAKAGDWVMQRRRDAITWPYNECKRQMTTQNWANGMIPQTEACYRAALDFTTLSEFKIDFLLASVPEPLMNLLDKIFGLVSLSLYTYGERTTIDVAPKVAQDYRYLRLNASFYPELDEGNQIVNFSYSTDKKAEYFNQVSLPYGVRFDLSSTSIPQATRVAYENKVIPSCTVTLGEITTLDSETYVTRLTPCYSMVSSDCGSHPLYGVFVRRTTGIYSLAVKVHVGGHTIEVIPDESGRRKDFTVKANDVEIDGDSYILPEGLNKFFVLKIRYQAPMFIISSPGAGLLVHYSGSHVTVFPTQVHRQQHCGLCGNFDGEADHIFYSPEGCSTKNMTQLLASYTKGNACFSSLEKSFC